MTAGPANPDSAYPPSPFAGIDERVSELEDAQGGLTVHTGVVSIQTGGVSNGPRHPIIGPASGGEFWLALNGCLPMNSSFIVRLSHVGETPPLKAVAASIQFWDVTTGEGGSAESANAAGIGTGWLDDRIVWDSVLGTGVTLTDDDEVINLPSGVYAYSLAITFDDV